MTKEKLIELLDQKDDLIESQTQMLLRQDRVRLLGESIEDLTDQWKNPLLSLNASANKLQIKKVLDLLADDIFEKEIDIILKNSDFLLQTLTDITHFCAQERVARVFEVDKVINRTLSIANTFLHGKDIAIDVKYEDSYVKGIENELMQALLNIIHNASDALMHHTYNRKIAINVFNENNECFIVIADNGGGIAPNVIEKIFDRYFTTKGDDGLGTGLFLTKAIITQCFSGKIDVKNSENGAVFTITLPQYEFLELKEK
jgi:signal transduction histidine kinase